MARTVRGAAIGTGVALLLVSGACSSSDSGSDEGVSDQTIGLRDPGPVDTGVIESYEQEAMPEDTPVEISPDGLTAELTACRQVGIEQWIWEGTIALPDGVDEATVELHLAEIDRDSDERLGWTITAQVTGSGPFTIERTRDLEPIDPYDEGVIDMQLEASSFQVATRNRFEACGLSVARADVAIATTEMGAEIEATHAEGAIAVDAEEGTIDALADGAHLGDLSDGRLPFAYVAAHEQPLPFDEVVVAPLDEVPMETILWWTPINGEDCPLIRFDGPVTIMQTDDCTDWDGGVGRTPGSFPPYTVDGSVEGLDDWMWVTDAYERQWLRGRVDSWWIQLSDLGESVESDAELIAIARSLYTVRNDRVAEVVPRRDTGPDLDVIVDDLIEYANGNTVRPWERVTERFRQQVGDDWLVFLDGRGNDPEWWRVEMWRAEPHPLGWRVHPEAGLVTDNGEFVPPPHAYCVGATAPFRDQLRSTLSAFDHLPAEEDPVEVVAAREPIWTLEGADAPGAWAPLPTTEGIWIGLDEAGDPVEKPPYLRAVDEQGRPVEGPVAAEHACLP